MNIINTTIEILNQLQDLVQRLEDSRYSKEMDVLSKGSIGKHVRHIVEFYGCLFNGVTKNNVDYDRRERNILLETSTEFAGNYLQDLKHRLYFDTADRPLQLDVCFSEDTDEKLGIQTTYYRELAYNIEHAIHHMAIIKIALLQEFAEIDLDANFGIAYSTLKHQKKQCAQ